MSDTEIIEGNKQIAEFMGAKIGKGGTKKYPVFVNLPIWHGQKMQLWTTSLKDVRYHESWDWLIPVCEKIKGFLHVSMESRPKAQRVLHALEFVNREIVYELVLKFIKWYNINSGK